MLRDASTQPLDLAVVDKMNLDALNADTIAKYRGRLEGVHQAIRESLVNSLVHADYYERQGVVIIKGKDFYRFSNPGLLRIPLEDAIAGGLSDPRNLTVFTMFTLLNIGERAGTGLSNIYSVWKQQGWVKPMLVASFDPERTTLILMMQKPKSAGKKAPIKKRR